ncbi:type III pantothenate kinase [Gammaproteobacteria bacterium]|nr:type III pantothenate kinase [Gammaproteobacteria bacterium]
MQRNYLLIDIGNSACKFALVEQMRVLQTGQMASADLPGDFARLDLARFPLERILVSNVAGRYAEESLSAWAARDGAPQPEWVGVDRRACGVINRYQPPNSLGVDRWAALVAVRQVTRTPAVVIDVGSAVTIDCLSAEGEFVGGWILPGLNLSMRALVEGTADIRVDFSRALDRAGLSTAGAVSAGTVLAVSGGVEAALRLARRRFANQAPEVFVTGGDGRWLLDQTQLAARYEPHLVLKGVAELGGLGPLEWV